MGLFDLFKTKKEDFSPVKMCVIAMIYLYKVDGDIAPEEVGSLLSVVGGKSSAKGIQVGGQSKGFIEDCLAYTSANSVETFVSNSKDKLTLAQKLYIVVNMLDASLADGKADGTEETLIERFIEGYGVDMETLSPIIQVLELKNDRKIFGEENYEKNAVDFKFEITM